MAKDINLATASNSISLTGKINALNKELMTMIEAGSLAIKQSEDHDLQDAINELKATLLYF